MKKTMFATILLALAFAAPAVATAEVSVGVNISLPLPIVFVSPPELVVIPGSYVYVAPDIDTDIYFYDGWWWRPWQGRWYRSRHYDSGWGRYRRVPSFYSGIPSGWRNDYREHRWEGRPWNYQRIPTPQLQRNWRGWEKDRHWERQQTWGVPGMKPQARPQARPQPAPQAAQPKPQARPQAQAAQPQRQQPQRQAVQPQRQQAEQQHRATQPQRQQSEPQHQAAQPQRQQSEPQHQAAQPQRQQAQPQHQAAQPQQRREAPEQGGSHGGGHQRGDDEKQERR